MWKEGRLKILTGVLLWNVTKINRRSQSDGLPLGSFEGCSDPRYQVWDAPLITSQNLHQRLIAHLNRRMKCQFPWYVRTMVCGILHS